jgi:beta-fructofuranosidase
LVIDQTKSSLRKYVPLQVRTGKYPITPGKPLSLRIFIDGSVVEGFINDQDAFTTRLFPSSGDSNQVELYSTGGTASLTKGVTWQLKSSNNQTAF